MTTTNIAYQVLDVRTQVVVKEFEEGKGKAAHKKAEKMNQSFGAVRYVVKMV